VRAHQTKPSPTLATSSFKRVYDKSKGYAWMPHVSNHTPHAKERRAAIMTSAHANCPLRNAQGSTRTFGRLIPNEANPIERTTNTEPYSTDSRRSFQPSVPAAIFREAVQVPVGRNAVTLAPSTRHTTSFEDGLSPCIKQQESVEGYGFDNFFDMDAYQNS